MAPAQFDLSVLSADLVTSNASNTQTEPTIGVVSFSWIGQSFTTDNTSYILDTITLHDMATFNSSDPFELRLYHNNSGVPGVSIATFSGPTAPPGTAIYTPASTVKLAPLTNYFAVGQTSGAAGYGWARTFDLSQMGPGSIGDSFAFSNDQSTSWNNSSVVLLLTVEGTAVPEPSAPLYGVMLTLAAAGFGCWKKWSADTSGRSTIARDTPIRT